MYTKYNDFRVNVSIKQFRVFNVSIYYIYIYCRVIPFIHSYANTLIGNYS